MELQQLQSPNKPTLSDILVAAELIQSERKKRSGKGSKGKAQTSEILLDQYCKPKRNRTNEKATKKEGKKCDYCQTTDSPEWRRGPSGEKTLCNACGLRFMRRQAKEKNTPAVPKKKKVKALNKQSLPTPVSTTPSPQKLNLTIPNPLKSTSQQATPQLIYASPPTSSQMTGSASPQNQFFPQLMTPVLVFEMPGSQPFMTLKSPMSPTPKLPISRNPNLILHQQQPRVFMQPKVQIPRLPISAHQFNN